MHTACCCCRCCCCCCVLYLVSDGNTVFVAGSLNLISAFPFSSFKHDLCLMYPLAVLSHLWPRFAYILGYLRYSGHARSPGGRQPAAAKPPSYMILTISGRPFITPDNVFFIRKYCKQITQYVSITSRSHHGQ